MATKKKTKQGLDVGVFHVNNSDPAVVAKCAEDLGFSSYWAPDHTVIPEGSTEIYPGKTPGTPTPQYLFQVADPMAALARASAVTRTIKLGTGVALVPERNPLLTAKEVATIDHYSGGRFLFGIGAGWNEPECRVMGGDFPRRWTQVTESIAAMKKLWTGEYVEHHGKYFDFPPVICLPRPVQRPHPPILLGSIGSPLVFKRTVEWGDGWLPCTADANEVANGRTELTRLAKAAGRDPASIDLTVFALPGYCRTAKEMADMAKTGANAVVIWLAGVTEAELTEEMTALAAEVF